MLTAAETVEAELSKKTTPGASALAVTEEAEEKSTKSWKPRNQYDGQGGGASGGS